MLYLQRNRLLNYKNKTTYANFILKFTQKGVFCGILGLFLCFVGVQKRIYTLICSSLQFWYNVSPFSVVPIGCKRYTLTQLLIEAIFSAAIV